MTKDDAEQLHNDATEDQLLATLREPLSILTLQRISEFGPDGSEFDTAFVKGVFLTILGMQLRGRI